jgi:signal transducing adaptor molecule
VEILKDASPEELLREAEEEAKILAEGRNIEKLLGLLANAEGGRGVEDEDLQGLYNSTLAIRPKLVKLIEKYSMRKGMTNIIDTKLTF